MPLMIFRIIKISMIGLVATVVLCSLGVYVRYTRQCSAQDLNVLLIVLDTVRADHLSCYGHEENTTPFIDKLAKGGTLFTGAYATAPWTLPSHASLFTGLYPYSHGATGEHCYLEDKYLTLAELLTNNDYQTASFSANPQIARWTNMTQGFNDAYVIRRRKHSLSLLDKIVQRIQGTAAGHPVNVEVKKWWIQKYAPDKPFFIFLNYMDAHSPHSSPYQQYKELFSTRGQREEIDKVRQWWPSYYLGDVQYEKEDFESLKASYDAEIRYLDDCVNDIIAFLEERGAMDNTLLIITSDHGENMGDHGLIDHVFSIYNTTLHIPLIIRHKTLFPSGRLCSVPVQINDIFATIIEASQTDTGNGFKNTYSLMPKSWETIPNDRIVFSQYFPEQALGFFELHELDEKDRDKVQEYRRSLESFIMGKEKIIVASDSSHEMYNIGADPDEKHNMYDGAKDRFKDNYSKLEDLKQTLEKASGLTSEPQLEEEDLEMLRALGYIP